MKPATILLATTLLATTAFSNSAQAAPTLLPPTVYTINWYNDTFPASACSYVNVRTLASNGAPVAEKTNGSDLAYRKTLIMDIPSAGCAAIKLRVTCGGKTATRDIPCSSGMAHISGSNPLVIEYR
jgi:hypothetical protein